MCILAAIPILLAAAFEASDMTIMVCVDMLLILIAGAVYLFVRVGSVWESYQKLLQEEDYTPENKLAHKRLEFFPGVYWCVVLALYLFVSFRSMEWHRTWVIWPVAGILFAAVYGALTAVAKNNMRK